VVVNATTYFPVSARAKMSQIIPENRSAEEWQLMRQGHHHGDATLTGGWRG